MIKVFVFDPTLSDEKSAVRGVGRYLQILKETFFQWSYIDQLKIINKSSSIFINPFFNFLKPPLTLKKITQKQIAVIHDLIPLKYPDHFPTGLRGKINIFLNNLALRNYDLIVTDSQASKKDIVRMLTISKDKVKVVYPCLPKVFRREKKESDKGKEASIKYSPNLDLYPVPKRFCLYVGDGTWNKNLVNLAKAIKIINVSCVFVGKVFDQKNSSFSHPWQKELKEFFKMTKNDQRFIFLGYVNDKKLLHLYQQAQVNILISRDEGFGFSFLEAASQECPSVVSNIDVLKEVSEGEGVVFADYNNPNDIADKIGEIYFNKSFRDRLGREAKKRVSFFRQEKFRQQFLEIVS